MRADEIPKERPARQSYAYRVELSRPYYERRDMAAERLTWLKTGDKQVFLVPYMDWSWYELIETHLILLNLSM